MKGDSWRTFYYDAPGVGMDLHGSRRFSGCDSFGMLRSDRHSDSCLLNRSFEGGQESYRLQLAQNLTHAIFFEPGITITLLECSGSLGWRRATSFALALDARPLTNDNGVGNSQMEDIQIEYLRIYIITLV